MRSGTVQHGVAILGVCSAVSCALATNGIDTGSPAGSSVTSGTSVSSGAAASSSTSSSSSVSSSSSAVSSSSAASSSSGTPPQPTCADGIRNGMETDVDCGGDACPPCALGLQCDDGADCASGNCANGRCGAPMTTCEPVDPQNPTCGDCVKDGLETDVDCGGDACPPCTGGQTCAIDADCTSGSCQNGTCGPNVPICEPVVQDSPTCDDCTQDGSETDVDCGGDACRPCGATKHCLSDGDCLSASCVGGTCQPGIPGTPCLEATDCDGAACQAGSCWTGFCCH